ncbi:MAG TPA: RluA family pseudouridine synthase [Opitutaceae bacterium]|nr:RluA family pseudouridine synthase [Opitutaceae bacterium]
MSADFHEQRPERNPLIALDALRSWILIEDDRLLVVNKPGDVVCHPSKNGPWSSLVGAAREYTGLPTVHLIFRLDRETSGVVVMAKDAAMASRLQKALMNRLVKKRYFVILDGELKAPVLVDQPLGKDVASPVWTKDVVTQVDSKSAKTLFTPLVAKNGFTVAEVRPETGRKHQIRAHAEWMGYRVVADKIYGPDSRHYIDFVENGWNPRLAAALPLPRQALHCAEIDMRPSGFDAVYQAPFPEDLRQFCRDRMEWDDFSSL